MSLAIDRLRSRLQRDYKAGVIVMGRGGHISRTHYARSIRVTPRYIGKCGIEVLSKYEKLLGGHDSTPEMKLKVMRQWLTKKFKQGALPLRNSRIDRKAFWKHFGFAASSPHRYPKIRALLAEFDKRAIDTGYLPRTQQPTVVRLKRLLSSAHCPRNRDKVTVNQTSLATKLGIPRHRLNYPPFVAPIVAKNAQLLAAAQLSRIDPYFNGRVFAFNSLAKRWPKAFIEAVAERFKKEFDGRRQATAYHNDLVRALAWIGDAPQTACANVRVCAQTRSISPSEWEDACHAYRDWLVASRLGPRSIKQMLSRINVALECLARGSVVPSLQNPLRGSKYANRKGGHRLSVVEATNSANPKVKSDAYVAFARDALVQAAEKFKVEVATEEASTFLTTLGLEIERAAQSNALPSNVPAAILVILTRRLAAITLHANKTLQQWVAHHQSAINLRPLVTINPDRFYTEYREASLNQYQRRLLVRQLFPLSDELKATGTANLLALAEHHHGGLLPPAIDESALLSVGQFYAKRYMEYGGLPHLDAYLNPHKDSFGAALTLYLCESGANVAVGRTLTLGCIEESDLDGHVRITGYKARAQGKPIIVDLPERSPAIPALRFIESSGVNIRRAASTSDPNLLFTLRSGASTRSMSEYWYCEWFKKFTASIPELESLYLVPSMIRPSVLLKAALENDGRLNVGAAIGQHSLTVTKGYQNKWPVRVIYDNKIRHFQDSLEALVTKNLDAAARKLRLPRHIFEKRVAALVRTGLGPFCADPLGRPGNDGRECTTFDCWNDCPQMIIIAEVQAIAALQLWQASLRSVQAEWERDRPERWAEVWLPWMCLADVVEEKMARGPDLRIWKQAEALRGQIESKTGFVPPRPW